MMTETVSTVLDFNAELSRLVHPKDFVFVIDWKPMNAILLSCGRRCMLSLYSHTCPEMCPKYTFLAFFSHGIFSLSVIPSC